TGRESQATRLVALATECQAEYFHTPDADPYACVQVDGHHETMAIGGKAFKQWLSRYSYIKTGVVPNASTLSDALNTIAAVARFEGDEHPVYVRVAAVDHAVVLDLGTATREAVRVTAED